MKIALFQTDIINGAPDWNIDKVSRWIEGLPADTDLAVLPEAFDTGDSEIIHESTTNILRKVAENCNIAISYSNGDHLVCILPSGKIENDTMHYKDLKISQNGGDLAIFSVSSPTCQNEKWREFALSNKCFVAGVNRIGYQYPGGSSIINCKGEYLATTDLNLECSISSEINIEHT